MKAHKKLLAALLLLFVLGACIPKEEKPSTEPAEPVEQITSETEKHRVPAQQEEKFSTMPVEAVETSAPTAEPAPAAEADYVINRQSGKFHRPDCFSVDRMKESNKEWFTGTREELLDRGLSPCGNCNP